MVFYLSMDFSTVVLYRYNFSTRTPTIIWSGQPQPAAMKNKAGTYIGRITGLDLSGVDWVSSELLLSAVNRPKQRRDPLGAGGDYR
ncbi:hypothetical protein [Actinokineospora sp.]|uniref:hypothetical protein n=1 Tax=Actinokineospora sp. TaxID=1872133 RepID=UPI003D6AF6F3